MCCCPESNSLCVTFVIGKVSRGMVSRGVEWCGVANPEKMPPTQCQKLPQRPLRQKRGSPNSRLASAYCIPNNALPWKQWHVTTLLYSTACLCTAVGMSAKWGVPVPNLSLLVILCLVFVGECIGNVINFKWLSKNINADASNLIGKAKFIVAVVGPVTLLSTDAALESRLPQQSPGSRNTNITILQSQICVTRWHHIMQAPVLQLTKNPGSPSGPPRWRTGWSAIILGCLT